MRGDFNYLEPLVLHGYANKYNNNGAPKDTGGSFQSFMKENRLPSSTHRRPHWLKYFSTVSAMVRSSGPLLIVSASTCSVESRSG